MHGANRLAGNSLLECVVFGRIAGRTAADISYDSVKGEFKRPDQAEDTIKSEL